MRSASRRPLISAGILLGAGMGGFLDGIVLHQILQWHNMLSSDRPPTSVVNLEINMFWDGLFHAFTWMMTAIGIGMLCSAAQRRDVPWSSRTLVGSLAVGWGLFNLVEGLINHQVLGIHHVKPGPNEFAWDMAFLAFGAVLVIGGLLLIRRTERLPS
jgi:uncharacterized membrane protein